MVLKTVSPELSCLSPVHGSHSQALVLITAYLSVKSKKITFEDFVPVPLKVAVSTFTFLTVPPYENTIIATTICK